MSGVGQKRQSVKYQQIIEGKWYDVEAFEASQCCLCGLVHLIDTRVKNGTIQQRYRVDHKLTARAIRKKLRI